MTSWAGSIDEKKKPTRGCLGDVFFEFQAALKESHWIARKRMARLARAIVAGTLLYVEYHIMQY